MAVLRLHLTLKCITPQSFQTTVRDIDLKKKLIRVVPKVLVNYLISHFEGGLESSRTLICIFISLGMRLGVR